MKIKKGIDYKWITIAMCFLMVMVSLGFTSSTKSLFPDEIAEELQTERTLVAIGESCRYISTAVVNIFFGFLVAKFGPKKLICSGFVFLILSMLSYCFANDLIMIYIGGTLLGIGLSCAAGSMLGQSMGVRLGRGMDTSVLHMFILFFICASAVMLLWRAFGL